MPNTLNFDEASLLQRFNRSSPDLLLQSIAMEFVRLHQVNAALFARVAALETLRTVIDRIAPSEVADEGAPYPTRIKIDAANSVLDALGLYGLEHDHNGSAYRWTGPEPQFTFSFFLDRSKSARFCLRFGQLYAAVPVEELRCFVDGADAALSVTKVIGGYEASGVLPHRSDRGGTVLTFVCPQMDSPESRGLADSRILGVAFRTLTVETDSEGPALGQAGIGGKVDAPSILAKG